MTPKAAKQILESSDTVSIEEIIEARSVLAKQEAKKKLTNLKKSLEAYQQWRRRNKEVTDLRNETKKYWPSSTGSK